MFAGDREHGRDQGLQPFVYWCFVEKWKGGFGVHQKRRNSDSFGRNWLRKKITYIVAPLKKRFHVIMKEQKWRDFMANILSNVFNFNDLFHLVSHKSLTFFSDQDFYFLAGGFEVNGHAINASSFRFSSHCSLLDGKPLRESAWLFVIILN